MLEPIRTVFYVIMPLCFCPNFRAREKTRTKETMRDKWQYNHQYSSSWLAFFYVKMRRGKFICTDLEKRACKKSDVKIDDRTLNNAENWSSHQQWSHHGKKDLFRIQKGLLDADASIVMFQTNNNVGFLNVPTEWPRPFFSERNAYIFFNFEVTQKSLNMGRFENYTFYLTL